jgi:large subunit ribosomal protein L24
MSKTTVNAINIKKNDIVIVTTGKDKGKKGKVLRILPDSNKAIVEKINFIMKHTRANPSKNQKGGILQKESPIHISNLMLICSECGQPSRIGYTRLQDGKKVRICRRCEGILDK